MATFITTISLTDQGLKAIEETCQRSQDFQAAVQPMGVTVRDLYWTLGQYDGLLILDAPDEATATAAMLHLSSLGNVHTHTTRAFNTAEMTAILRRLPK